MKKMISPADLQAKTVAQDVTGKYDWNKQTYMFNECKFGTNSSTSMGTRSGIHSMGDDTNWDSYTD